MVPLINSANKRMQPLRHHAFFSKALLPFLFLFAFNISPSFSQSEEYTLKAFYIEKFTRFIIWPADCPVKEMQSPFIITVLGNTPFEESLRNIYSIQKIYDRPVEIHNAGSVDEIDSCRVLFIAHDQKNNLPAIRQYVRNRPILTVSDAPGFSESGVLINFFIEQETLQFEVNETALHRSPLDLSYYLLDLARIVSPIKKQQGP
jgi:hypothetical protein